ncbi:MAG: hypothetical protein IKP87_06230 [Victivallales bacterium]|nr:hypothetical protein [Victivallales bacterium]
MNRHIFLSLLGFVFINVFNVFAIEPSELTFLPVEHWRHGKHVTVEATGGHNGHDRLRIQAKLPDGTMSEWKGNSKENSSRFFPVEPGKPYSLSVWAKGIGTFWLHVWTYEKENLSSFVYSSMLPNEADRFTVIPDNEWHHCVSPTLVLPPRSNYVKIVLELVGPALEVPYIDLSFSEVEFVETAMAKTKPGRVAIVKAITDKLLTPARKDISELEMDTLSFKATHGEYSPASFVVEAPENKDLEAVMPVAIDLVSADGHVIPASALDFKHLVTWYTGAPQITYKQKNVRMLTPELLLNDPTLVKASDEDRGNYLRLDFPNRSFYTYISASMEERNTIPYREDYHLDIKDFPVRDSASLKPVRIPAGERRQFWATLHAPSDAPAGVYRGKIRIANGKETFAEIPVEAEILPFELLPAENYISSIYYKGQLGPNGAIGAGNFADSKNEKQYLAEMRDLMAHGVTNPPIFQWWRGDGIQYLDKILNLREKAGMSNRVIFLWGSNTGASDKQEELAKLKESVEQVFAIARPHGVEEIYFYGIDEARGDVLAKEQAAWKVVHDAGGKVYVAVMNLADCRETSLDMAVVCGTYYTAEEVAKARAKGRKLLSYANPQGGCIRPETYRRNYGLLIWQWGFDGAMTHAYQCGYGHIWNDFDGPYRDENMAYPTADGVIDTIQWEGYREGIDDLRYLATLNAALRKAAADRPAAMQATRFLAELKKSDLSKLDLDDVRKQMIDHILKLLGNK